MNVSTIVTKSKAFTQLSNCYSSVSPVMGCRVTLYLSQGSALSQVNYDPQNSLSGGEKNPQSSGSSSLDTVSSSPRSHERTILGWDNIIPQETRGRNACLTVQSGDSAEPRKEWREKEWETEPMTLKERRTDLLQWGRSEGEIWGEEKTPFRGAQRRNSSTDGDVRDAPAWKCRWLSAGGKLKDFCL